MDPVTERKGSLRRSMREWRRSLSDDELERRSSLVICGIERSGVLDGAATVMGFTAVRGEPDLAALATSLINAGVSWTTPEREPDPTTVDVVFVPGVAFTAHGDRLGQGGGWYDRFLPTVRADARVIGVCFGEQILDEFPIEDHDVRVDQVISDRGGPTVQVSS